MALRLWSEFLPTEGLDSFLPPPPAGTAPPEGTSQTQSIDTTPLSFIWKRELWSVIYMENCWRFQTWGDAFCIPCRWSSRHAGCQTESVPKIFSQLPTYIILPNSDCISYHQRFSLGGTWPSLSGVRTWSPGSSVADHRQTIAMKRDHFTVSGVLQAVFPRKENKASLRLCCPEKRRIRTVMKKRTNWLHNFWKQMKGSHEQSAQLCLRFQENINNVNHQLWSSMRNFFSRTQWNLSQVTFSVKVNSTWISTPVWQRGGSLSFFAPFTWHLNSPETPKKFRKTCCRTLVAKTLFFIQRSLHLWCCLRSSLPISSTTKNWAVI